MRAVAGRWLDVAGPAAAQAQRADAAKGIDGERAFRRQAEKRDFLNRLGVANAAKTLARLPEPNETVHVLMSGNFAGWDWVRAVIDLASPAFVRHLAVATLGFNAENAHELLTLIDDRTIRGVDFLCSHYFKSTTPETFGPLEEALVKRGQRIRATRNHAKLILMQMSDGRSIVIDGSMNLRSCRNVEQVNITDSGELYLFYLDYIQEAVA